MLQNQNRGLGFSSKTYSFRFFLYAWPFPVVFGLYHRGPSYPPYNIEKTADDAYRISVAVAGFSDTDLNVDVKENALIISAQKPEANDAATYLHRGIATRAFERRFQLADHVRVQGASYSNGMLHIDLVRELPEAYKPRRIEITSAVAPEIVDAKVN